MTSQSKAGVLVNKASTYALFLILNLIDMCSYGTGILHSEIENVDYQAASTCIFLASMVFFQLSYNCITKMRAGITGGPITEIFSIIRHIHCAINANNGGLIDLYVVVASSTMIYGLISLLFGVFNISYIAQLIPTPVLSGCLLSIGISQFEISYGSVGHKLQHVVSDSLILGLFFVMCLGLFFVQKRYPNSTYISTLAGIVLTLAFYAHASLRKGQGESETPVAQKVDLAKGFLTTLKSVDSRKMNLRIVWKMKKDVLNLVIGCLIHLPLNLMSYSASTGVRSSLQKEFQTQGIANILGAPFMLPGYFINSYSIVLWGSGFATRAFSISLGIGYCLLFFVSGFIQSHVPKFVLAIYPTLVGISLSYSGLVDSWNESSLAEYVILAITAGVSTYKGMKVGFFVGLVLCFALYLFYDSIVAQKMILKEDLQFLATLRDHPTEIDYVRINFVLFFVNVQKFKRKIAAVKGDIVILDLLECNAFDALGNAVFKDLLKNTNKKFVVIGRPDNANIEEVKHFENVRCCVYYEDAECMVDDIYTKRG